MQVGVRQPFHEETVRKCVVRAMEELEETFRKEKKNLLQEELRRVQQFAVDVTLDPDTASPWLILSHDGKQAHLGDMKKSLPDKPERFHPRGGVLGRQVISSGRWYYEVHVKGKTKWDLGVVKESVNRKEILTRSHDDDHWILSLRKGNEYKARACPDVTLSLTWHPQKVGVFVDFEEGVVSFYNVDAADIIYSFTSCCFSAKLRPFFNPGPRFGGINTTPLIISPVSPNT
ncbi:hypothetical protein LDENG_00212260 [Lucifuga dentata]|nr:hypothetical protein LDENG_00212260 [Lucifuga dentata]